jgi:hypothetical protein
MTSLNSEMVVTENGKVTVYEPLADMRTGGIGFVSSLGCSMKNFRAELGYEISAFSGDNAAGFVFASPALILSYRILK